MYKIFNLTRNPNVEITDKKGPYTVITHQKDFSKAMDDPQNAWYSSNMEQKKRQLIVELSKGDVVLEPGTMQWMAGDVEMTSGVTGVLNYLSRKVKGKITGNSGVRPIYTGTGTLVLEPVDSDILLLHTQDWNHAVVLAPGLFLSCEAQIEVETITRDTVSGAVLGNEGLFNLCLMGDGYAALRLPVNRSELVEVILEDDILRIDGSCALAWSDTLNFTVEKSGRTLMASALSQEGLVNTYTGTGKVLMAPFRLTKLSDEEPEQEKNAD